MPHPGIGTPSLTSRHGDDTVRGRLIVTTVLLFRLEQKCSCSITDILIELT